MHVLSRTCVGLLTAALVSVAQQYSITTIAGVDPAGDGRPATEVVLGQPTSVYGDASGALYIADYLDDRIRKLGVTGIISNIAGDGIAGFRGDDGPAIQAAVSGVRGLVADAAGNLFFVDTGNHRVRKIDVAGKITTVATTAQIFSDKTDTLIGREALPRALAIDSTGVLYVTADWTTYLVASGLEIPLVMFSRIAKVEPSGRVTIVGGDRGGNGGDGGAATNASFGLLTGIAVDTAGNIYVADEFSNRVRRISAAGTVMAFAGTGLPGFAGEGGPASAANFGATGVALDRSGNVYIADANNARVLKIDARTGVLTAIAGNGTYGFGGDGGPARSAMLAHPSAVWVNNSGDVFIADEHNGRIRQVSADGIIRTIAGAPVGDGGPAVRASLSYPGGIAVGSAGDLYIADSGHNRIRRIDDRREIQTMAGSGYGGFADGRAASVRFRSPESVAMAANGDLYVADSDNYRIRKVTQQGLVTTIAGTGEEGYSGDGGLATRAEIGRPTSIAVDSGNNVYFNDVSFYRIRKVDSGGTITTIAGNGKSSFDGDGGPAVAAQLYPSDICVDTRGSIFVADSPNHRVRKIDSNGTITTVVGTGTAGSSGDGGPASSARVNRPGGVAVDRDNNLYIAERGSFYVRRVSPTGIVSRIAGAGKRYFSGDNTSALAVDLDPYRLTADQSGSVYVADWVNGRIRRLTPLVAATLILVTGDGQTGFVGSRLGEPLVVRVNDGAGFPVSGITVAFAVTSGSATLSSTTAVTAADGSATTLVTLGDKAGPVVITATVAGAPVVTFKLVCKDQSPQPRLTPGGVAGASLSVPPVRALSPNGLAVVSGENLAAQSAARESDLTSSPVPTELAGTCVTVGDKRAALLSVRPDRVTFQAPYIEGSNTVNVIVAVKCGTADEVRSDAEAVAYQTAAPEFQYFANGADGRSPVKAIRTETGESIGPEGLLPGGTFVPANPGGKVTLYAIGLGITTPPTDNGAISPNRRPLAGSLEVWIGDLPVPADAVFYAGAAPGTLGTYIIELQLPNDLPDGELPVVASVNGIASPTEGFLLVRRRAPEL